jgi:small-conductance mechanosensitive channel
MQTFWETHQDSILQYLQAFGFLIISLFAGWMINRFLMETLKSIDKRRQGSWFNMASKYLRGPLDWFFPLLLGIITLPLHGWSESWAIGIGRLLEAALYIVGGRLVIESTEVFGEIIRQQYQVDQENNLAERKLITQLGFIKRLVTLVVMLLVVAFILLQFESVREIGTGLLTSAGVAGVIIGFAAQKSIANLLAGFQIAFTQPIRIDDAVIVEGEWGRVEEITLTYVVIRIWDKRRLILPLHYFIEKPFQNWTRNSADLVGVVMLHVDYNLPVDVIREKLHEILKDHPLWDREVKKVQVTETMADTVQVRLLVGARNAPQAFDLRCDVREAMIEFIRTQYPDSLPRTRVEMHPLTSPNGGGS